MVEYGQKITFNPNNPNFTIASPSGALSVQDFKPAMRLKDVWDGVFNYLGYTYSGTFWQQPWLQNVYFLLDNALTYPQLSGSFYGTSSVNLETYGQIRIGPVSGSGQTNVTLTYNTTTQLPWYSIQKDPQGFISPSTLAYSVERYTNLTGTIGLNFTVVAGSGNEMPQFQLQLKDNATSTVVASTPLWDINTYMAQIQTYNGSTTKTQTFFLETAYNIGVVPPGNYYWCLKWTSIGSGTITVVLEQDSSCKSYLGVGAVKQAADWAMLDMTTQMPFGTRGIKIVEFIAAIQKKFHLTIVPDYSKANNFKIETFNDWIKLGSIKSFDKYVNVDLPISVTPANNLAANEVYFGDSLDTDYFSLQFNKLASREFGKSYYVDTNNYFSQNKFEVQTVFGSTPLVYLQNTGISGSGNIPGLISVRARFTNSSDYNAVCYSPIDTIVWTETGHIGLGLIVYGNSTGTSVISGFSYVKEETAGSIYEINYSTGEVGALVGFCP
jgi:hypothetical protein